MSAVGSGCACLITSVQRANVWRFHSMMFEQMLIPRGQGWRVGDESTMHRNVGWLTHWSRTLAALESVMVY